MNRKAITPEVVYSVETWKADDLATQLIDIKRPSTSLDASGRILFYHTMTLEVGKVSIAAALMTAIELHKACLEHPSESSPGARKKSAYRRAQQYETEHPYASLLDDRVRRHVTADGLATNRAFLEYFKEQCLQHKRATEQAIADLHNRLISNTSSASASKPGVLQDARRTASEGGPSPRSLPSPVRIQEAIDDPLLEQGRHLSGGQVMPVKTNSKRGLPAIQRKCIFVGCRETANELGESAEAYRYRIMKEELGINSLSNCNRTGDFDKLMQRIFSDRGEYSRALEYVGGDIRRLAFLATEAAKAILAGKGVDRSDEHFTNNALRYVESVMVQMRMSTATVDSLAFKLRRADGWDDFSPVRLKKVVSALQLHIRRKS